MALFVRDYLRAGNTPDSLRERGITHRRHSACENLVLFKYGIVESDWSDPIVRECRGIVLDEQDAWRPVCRAFDKFFNHGESHAATIDWSTARVQEKLDGSLATLYAYDGAWHVATTGTPDASGHVHGAANTFCGYFWNTFDAEGGFIPDVKTHGHLCFSFELMGPANRVVVVHDKPWLRLIAVRDRETGESYDPEDFAKVVSIPAVRSFPLGTINDILASFESISPVSQEGYVVVDAAFNRIKIKHPGYVALHHAKDGMTTKAFVSIARTGETSEVVAAFPEFAPMLADAKERYARLCAEVRTVFAGLRDIEAQKDFALQAVTYPFSAALFQMRRGTDPETYFRDLPIDRLVQMLGLKDRAAGESEAA